MSIKFTTPKKRLEALVQECLDCNETEESVVLPLLLGLIAVTFRHAAAKGFTDGGTHEKPVWRSGSARKGRPGGWSTEDRAQDPPSVPGAQFGWTFVVDGPRNAKGQYTYEKRVRWQSAVSQVVARSGQYRRALLAAAQDLERGDRIVLDSVSYRHRRDGSSTDNAYLSVAASVGGQSLSVALDLNGVWAALEGATKNVPQGRRVVGQRLRNNRKALVRVLQEAGNPWGLGHKAEKYAGWRPKPVPQSLYQHAGGIGA